MLDILAAAIIYDRTRVLGLPNVRAVVLPNSAEVVALITGTAMRVQELMWWRWKHIDWENEIIIVPGTKSANAVRVIPLQHHLRPWIERLRALQGGDPDPNHFVVRTRIARNHPGSKRTYQGRLSRVISLAGHKLPGKATHVFRATHATWAYAAGLSKEPLKLYLGHAQAFGGATDAYIMTMRRLIPAEHRDYLRWLPIPEDVEAHLAAWVPPGTVRQDGTGRIPNWR